MYHKLSESLAINKDRYECIVGVKEAFLEGKITLEEGNQRLREQLGTCTPDEFAYAEQSLKGSYKDEEIKDRMDDLLALFDGVLVRTDNVYPKFHPLWVYVEEIKALALVIQEARELLKQGKFIKNPWLGIFDSLKEWKIHLSRKQNQLYPALERHDFDRPSRIMWSFDNEVRDRINRAFRLLQDDEVEEFLKSMPDVLDGIIDLNDKEQEVLYPTAMKLLSEQEWIAMSSSDHEIGFALLEVPPVYNTNDGDVDQSVQAGPTQSAGFVKELTELLEKYHMGQENSADRMLDVRTGKLTLEQINLIFQHMPVDLSFVDEQDIMRFYTDTSHRIFPRSASVIGREVRNCHPASSVHVVEEIINAFKRGEQDHAEFWIQKDDTFIYILYTAVRDDLGKFKGILEMMQDCTHIRSLEESRTLLTWDTETTLSGKTEDSNHTDIPIAGTHKDMSGMNCSDFLITPKTTLAEVIKECPTIVDYLVSMNPKFKKLHSPMVHIMAKVATMQMISQKASMKVEELIAHIYEHMAQNHKK